MALQANNLLVFLGAVTWVSECEQTWSLFECFAELLDCACVELEGSGLPLVRSPDTSGEFTSDCGYFALLSFVGCIGTFLVSVVSGRTRLPSSLLRLLRASPCGQFVILLSLIIILGSTVRYVGSGGHSNHENAEVF